MGKNTNFLKIGTNQYDFRPFATCSTASGTTAKTASLSGFELYSGATIIVKFTNGNSATAPTLNVNSKGAKTINKAGLSTLTWPANSVVELVYNGSSYDCIGLDVNYTTGIKTGASGTNSNSATSNPYIKVLDNTTYRSQIQLKGSGATSVSSDANGVITINSTAYSNKTASSGGTDVSLVTTGDKFKWDNYQQIIEDNEFVISEALTVINDKVDAMVPISDDDLTIILQTCLPYGDPSGAGLSEALLDETDE